MNSRPYEKYEATRAWKIIDDGISALVGNQDIEEMTLRSNIVGYLVKQLVEAGAIVGEEEVELSSDPETD